MGREMLLIEQFQQYILNVFITSIHLHIVMYLSQSCGIQQLTEARKGQNWLYKQLPISALKIHKNCKQR